MLMHRRTDDQRAGHRRTEQRYGAAGRKPTQARRYQPKYRQAGSYEGQRGAFGLEALVR